MKKFFGLFSIIILLFLMAVAIIASGCSKVSSAKIINGVEKAIDVAGTVCSAAPLFYDNLAKPADKCNQILQKAVELKEDNRVMAFVTLAKCVETYRKDKNKSGLVQCVDDIDGAKLIISEIEK